MNVKFVFSEDSDDCSPSPEKKGTLLGVGFHNNQVGRLLH